MRDRRALRKRVEEAVGSHADVAFRAGLHPARLSQILSGAAPVIRIQQAARLEDVLGVPRAKFFKVEDPEVDAKLVGPYLDEDEPAEGRAVVAGDGEG